MRGGIINIENRDFNQISVYDQLFLKHEIPDYATLEKLNFFIF